MIRAVNSNIDLQIYGAILHNNKCRIISANWKISSLLECDFWRPKINLLADFNNRLKCAKETGFDTDCVKTIDYLLI
jgi:hypothetical protein